MTKVVAYTFWTQYTSSQKWRA